MGTLHCVLNGRKFTTMRCSRFEMYVEEVYSARLGQLCGVLLNSFHSWSSCCITPSPSMANILRPKTPHVVGIPNGCDTTSFTPTGPKSPEIEDLARPIWLYVGRVCKEKNIGAAMDLGQ